MGFFLQYFLRERPIKKPVRLKIVEATIHPIKPEQKRFSEKTASLINFSNANPAIVPMVIKKVSIQSHFLSQKAINMETTMIKKAGYMMNPGLSTMLISCSLEKKKIKSKTATLANNVIKNIPLLEKEQHLYYQAYTLLLRISTKKYLEPEKK